MNDLECMNSYDNNCSGEVEYRMSLTGTGTSMIRCDFHQMERLDLEHDLRERYPYNAPSNFDPAYCGERWDDEY